MQDKATEDLGHALIEDANRIAADTRAVFGNPTAMIAKKRIMTDAILRIAGCDKGAPITPQVIAALDAGAAIVGMLNAPTPGPALSHFLSVGINAAPVAALVDMADMALKARAAAPQPAAPPQAMPPEQTQGTGTEG
jgi:hypothetical protein